MSLKIASPNEKTSIYKIFRSCRLCGSEGGYKMPIIQNLFQFEDTDLEISQKIKECAQIEVTIDDKMPPLICETCIEKLNEFHAYKLHCKNINNQTRTRLGLSPLNISSKQQSHTGIIKNSKSVKGGSSTLIPLTKKNISTKREGRISNKVMKVKKNYTTLEVPQKYTKQKHNSQITTQDKLESIKIKETEKIHTEISREYSKNCNNHNNAIKNYNNGKKYKCDFCAYSSFELSNVKRHERTHTGERPYKCNECYNTYTTNFELKAHARTHTGEKPFECKVCEYKFTTSRQLKRHEMKHIGIKPYKCNECEYRSYYKCHLKSHIITTHSGEKPFTGEKAYKCDICEYRCYLNSHLKLHQRTHAGEKPYKCNVCEYRCTRGSYLKLHQRTHTGEKPYKCNVCEYRCKSNSHLTLHQRTHTGEKPYKCDVCEYRCTNGSALKKHKRKHTGEKPYKCNVCEYKYTDPGNLKAHKKKHTGV